MLRKPLTLSYSLTLHLSPSLHLSSSILIPYATALRASYNTLQPCKPHTIRYSLASLVQYTTALRALSCTPQLFESHTIRHCLSIQVQLSQPPPSSKPHNSRICVRNSYQASSLVEHQSKTLGIVCMLRRNASERMTLKTKL